MFSRTLADIRKAIRPASIHAGDPVNYECVGGKAGYSPDGTLLYWGDCGGQTIVRWGFANAVPTTPVSTPALLARLAAVRDTEAELIREIARRAGE